MTAKAGEKVTCTNGHVICEVVKDLNTGDMNWGDNFGNWTQEPPKTGQLDKPVCAVCGADFFDPEPGSWAMHFEDGTWRPDFWGFPG
jgi:hypothetical protein